MKSYSRTGAADQLDDIWLDSCCDTPVAIQRTAAEGPGATPERLAHRVELLHARQEQLAVGSERVDSALTLNPCNDAILDEVGAVAVEVVIGVGVEGDILALALTIAVHSFLKAVAHTPISVGFLDALCMVRDGEEELSPGEFAKLFGSIEESTVAEFLLRTDEQEVSFTIVVSVRGELAIPEEMCSFELLLLGLRKTIQGGELNLGRDDISDELCLALDIEARVDCGVSMGLDSLVESCNGADDDLVRGAIENHIVFPFLK